MSVGLRSEWRWAPLLLGCFFVACSSEGPDAYRASAEAAAATISAEWIAARVTILASDEMAGRDNLSAGGGRAREYLIAELKALGAKPFAGEEWVQPFDQGENIVAMIPGSDPELAAEFVILSAHYDHLGRSSDPSSQCRPSSTDGGDTICNGAGDNATGCAAALAIARALVASEAGIRRSLLLVFWDAEEDGMLGSQHFVDHAVVPLDSVAAMVNLDTLAVELFAGYAAFFALGTEYADILREHVAANGAAAGSKAYTVSEFFAGGGDAGRSDHAPFRSAAVPFIWFSSGAPDVYHTPRDEVDTVDHELLASMARTILLTTADLANRGGRPTFLATPRPHLDDARALIEIGEAVRRNPAALGMNADDPLMGVLDSFLETLRAYLTSPPSTDAEWEAYQRQIKSIISMVYLTMGR